MINFRENYKNWPKLVNTNIPIGVIGDVDKNRRAIVYLSNVALLNKNTNIYEKYYAFSYNTESYYILNQTFPATKDWNALVQFIYEDKNNRMS